MPKPEGTLKKLLLIERMLYDKTNDRSGLTLLEISARLSAAGAPAERKSIYAAIALLAECGMDIALVREGARSEYRLLSREFSLMELKLLADAAAANRFLTQRKSRDLIEKLGRLACESDRACLRREVHVDRRVKSMNESVYYAADAINTALTDGRLLAFDYFDYTPARRRRVRGRYTVTPLGLVVCGENYYLCAYSAARNGIRNYRVDRMAAAEVLPQPCEHNELTDSFDLVTYREQQFSMFGGTPCVVDIEFDNSLANVAIDYFGADVMMRPQSENTFAVSRRVELSPAFFGWLFQFGRRCRLLSPESARQKFQEMINDMKEFYDEN